MAQTLYFNGPILTMEADQPEAEAVLTEGDRIVAVGAESSVAGRAGRGCA